MENQIVEKTSMKWCIVRTISNNEKKISDKLKKESINGDLVGIVGRILVPIQKNYYVKAGKKIEKQKIMYPGYIFVETSSIGELQHFVKMMTGVIGILCDRNKKPQILQNKEVENMIGIQQEVIKKQEKDNKFIINQNIKIMDGPFKSFNGIVESIKDDKVKISVMIFGRKTFVDLDINQISKLDE
jgi:transcriptional antiterminator NusG